MSFAVNLKHGRLHDAPSSLRVTKGDNVVIRWSSDRAVELHLHGYDLHARPRPGRPAEMAFEAHATGRFPIELHGASSHHGPAIYLEVYPE